MSDFDKCTGQFAPHGICEPVEGYGQCPELLPRAVTELSDLCAAKDAEIAKLREAVEQAYREGYAFGYFGGKHIQMPSPHGSWEKSAARRALEAEDE